MSVFDKLNAGDPGSVIVMFDRDTGWDTMGEASFEPVRQVAIDDDWSPETTRPRERTVVVLSGLLDRPCGGDGSGGIRRDRGGSRVGGRRTWGRCVFPDCRQVGASRQSSVKVFLLGSGPGSRRRGRALEIRRSTSG